MWSILQVISSLFWNSLLDFIFFVIIDAFAKITLGDSRSHEEKRVIWFGESVVLALTCFIIYLCDHTPILLIVLTLITFVYTQLGTYFDIRGWWVSTKTRWEEYQQHQESLQKMKEQMISQQQQQALRQSIALPHVQRKQQQQQALWQSISMRVMQKKQEHDMLQQGSGLVMLKTRLERAAGLNQPQSVFTQTQPPVHQTVDNAGDEKLSMWSRFRKLKLLDLFKRSSEEEIHHQQSPLKKREYSFAMPQVQTQASTAYNPSHLSSQPLSMQGSSRGTQAIDHTPVRSSAYGDNLIRRPIRAGNKIPFSSAPSPRVSSDGYSIRNRFMNAFGFTSGGNLPPGMRNEGQNLCFMNSVIQCLARSPSLVQQLSLESAKDSECSVAESLLLSTLREILDNCTVKNGSKSVLDPIAFRQAASSLPNSIVAIPTQRQTQQDSAEFLMWLMDSVHGLLNKNRKGFFRCSKEALSKNERLKTLQFIYGDLTEAKIQHLKKACKQEIDIAHGLQNDSYAEAVQRLSDLEWLTYKKENDSVIDNLFTGQLVIGYHCLTDNRIVVNMQSFNILPVPIVAPREVSGLVNLADCFTKFCNVEQLSGQDGLDHNSWCPGAVSGKTQVPNSPMFTSSPLTHATPKVNGRQHSSSADSAVGGLHSPLIGNPLMSPIPGNGEIYNDSGFQDNVFKTSTPIMEGGHHQSFVPHQQRHLRDAQRRCLLRQLPECLVIQLMRFSFNPFTRLPTKLLAPVSIPIKDLDLTQIMFDTVTNREDLSASDANYKYDLYGVCLHIGADSTSFGHYISYCLQPENKTWYRFDDEHVTEVNMEYELTTQEVRENAYILFYKKAAKV